MAASAATGRSDRGCPVLVVEVDGCGNKQLDSTDWFGCLDGYAAGYTGLLLSTSDAAEVRRDRGGELDQGGVEMIQMCHYGLVTERYVPGSGGSG
jgi:hypothetical protein